MSDVFISYASSSRAVAARLAAGVERLGYKVWWDTELLPHDQYGQMIERQLEAAKCVIVLWSDDARESRWVLSEANRALGEGKLIQGNLSDRLPPLPFDQIQIVDLDGWKGDDDHPGWMRIAASVHHLAGGKPLSPLGLLSAARTLPRKAVPQARALVVAGVICLSALPLIAERILLSDAQDFLRNQLTPVAVFLVTIALLLFVPGRRQMLRTGLIAAAVVGSLAAVTAQAMLAANFIESDPENKPMLLGCGAIPESCTALRNHNLTCTTAASVCPFDGNDLPKEVLNFIGYKPDDLYGQQGIERVKLWMHLAWNGLFLSLAVLGAALLAPLVPPRRVN
ncbi:MAG TPA: toll/interleukin-1 receptor domain-containing protein [Novosphingobium sp.]|nr:toll/interleukin-1 receptor domain-containing protein [Novosphingobium sp.]